jgi:hypothetical protein
VTTKIVQHPLGHEGSVRLSRVHSPGHQHRKFVVLWLRLIGDLENRDRQPTEAFHAAQLFMMAKLPQKSEQSSIGIGDTVSEVKCILRHCEVKAERHGKEGV